MSLAWSAFSMRRYVRSYIHSSHSLFHSHPSPLVFTPTVHSLSAHGPGTLPLGGSHAAPVSRPPVHVCSAGLRNTPGFQLYCVLYVLCIYLCIHVIHKIHRGRMDQGEKFHWEVYTEPSWHAGWRPRWRTRRRRLLWLRLCIACARMRRHAIRCAGCITYTQ